MNRLSNLYDIKKAIDIGAPGHYARVYMAWSHGMSRNVAFKFMRAEHLFPSLRKDGTINNKDFEWKAFQTEVRALSQFDGHDMVVDFYDCGYIEIDFSDDDETMRDNPTRDDNINSMGRNVAEFIAAIEDYRDKHWRPYIVTEYVERRLGTVFVYNAKKHFPTHTVLEIISQFIDLLVYIQQHGFAYLDHKLHHTYWIFYLGRLKVIDWNGGQFLGDNRQELSRLLKEDGRDLILKIMYSLLVGDLPDEVGVRPLGGWTNKIQQVNLPNKLPGKSLLQPFFDQVADWQFEDAKALRIRFDELMLDYGLKRYDNYPKPQNENICGQILTALREMNDALDTLNNTKSQIENRLQDPELPIHFREEFEGLYVSLQKILNSNDIFTDTIEVEL